MEREKSATYRASEDESPPEHTVDAAFEPLDLAKITKQGLCRRCQTLSRENFIKYVEEDLKLYTHHESLLSLRESVRRGCPFCMFLWKQLGILTISRSPQRKVRYYNYIWSGHIAGESKTVVSADELHARGVDEHADFRAEFSVDLHPLSHTSGTKPLTGDTGSSGTIQQIRQWLKDCSASHSKCLVGSDEAFVPTRLLDVSQWHMHGLVRLVVPRELPLRREPYIALSHRWNDQVRATSTTRTNLSTRLEVLETDTLPRNFTDAFEATISLGINYLWIDSLCILQDDLGDWALEASLMSQVYRNAYLTISASLHCTESVGLFRKFNVENDSAEFVLVDKDGTSTPVRVRKDPKSWAVLISENPLQSRGWCFQERELSPRVVHWTEEQVFWECCTWTMSECTPGKNIPTITLNNTARAFNDCKTVSVAEIYNLWHRTVGQYTQRKLSVTQDRFAALSGVARIINERAKSVYLAGIWAADLTRGLLWTNYPFLTASRPDTYIAPSWSWAALNGRIQYEDLPLGAPYVGKGLAIITHHKIDLCTPDPYGAVRSGTLHLRAPLVAGYLKQGSFDSFVLHRTSAGRLASSNYGYMVFDVPTDHQKIRAVKCIALWAIVRQTDRDIGGIGRGIALVPVEKSKHMYRRIGYIFGLKMDVSAEAEVKEVVII